MEKKLYKLISSDTGRTKYNNTRYVIKNEHMFPVKVTDNIEKGINYMIDFKIETAIIDSIKILQLVQDKSVKYYDLLSDDIKVYKMRLYAYKNMINLLRYNNDFIWDVLIEEYKLQRDELISRDEYLEFCDYILYEAKGEYENYEIEKATDFLGTFVEILEKYRIINAASYNKMIDEEWCKQIAKFFVDTTIDYDNNYKYYIIMTLLLNIARECFNDIENAFKYIEIFCKYTNIKSVIKDIKKYVKIKGNINGLISNFGNKDLMLLVINKDDTIKYIILISLFLYKNMFNDNEAEEYMVSCFLDMRRICRIFCNKLKFELPHEMYTLKNDVKEQLNKINIELNDDNYGVLYDYSNVYSDVDVSIVDDFKKAMKVLKKNLITVSHNDKIRKDKKPRTSMKDVFVEMFEIIIMSRRETKIKKGTEAEVIREAFNSLQKSFLGEIEIDLSVPEYTFHNKKGSLAYCCNYTMVLIFISTIGIEEGSSVMESIIKYIREVHDNGYRKKYNITELSDNIIKYWIIYDLFKRRFEVLLCSGLFENKVGHDEDIGDDEEDIGDDEEDIGDDEEDIGDDILFYGDNDKLISMPYEMIDQVKELGIDYYVAEYIDVEEKGEDIEKKSAIIYYYIEDTDKFGVVTKKEGISQYIDVNTLLKMYWSIEGQRKYDDISIRRKASEGGF